MLNTSDEFKELMKSKTDFREYADITLPDGTVLSLDASQFTISNNSIIDGAGVSAFPLGVAVQKNIQIEILNNEQQYADYSFVGAKIRLYLTFQLSDSVEKVEKGTYTVVTPETYGETIIITAYDDMYKADKEYSTSIAFPATAGEVLRDACSSCDIYLYSTSFSHDDFEIKTRPTGTFRQVIGHIAMIACGNARIDTQNRLQILTYDFGGFDTEGAYHVLEDFKSPKIEYNDTVITGFKTVIKGETAAEDEELLVGTDTYVVNIENPLIEGDEQTVLEWLEEAICNNPFRTFSGDLVANPLVEFMDLAKVMDRKGNYHNTFITDVNFVFFGFTTLKNAVPAMVRANAKYSSDSSKSEQSARRLVEKERSDRELAIEQLNQSLQQASGMFATEQEQEDGSVIYYLHDKKTLEESTNVIKTTSQAIGFSTDGGETYPFGITIDGSTIMKIVETEGLNAEWINAGTVSGKYINAKGITVTTADAEVTFSIDENGNVSLSGEIKTSTLNNYHAVFRDGEIYYYYKDNIIAEICTVNDDESSTTSNIVVVNNRVIDINRNVNGVSFGLSHSDTNKLDGSVFFICTRQPTGDFTDFSIGGEELSADDLSAYPINAFDGFRCHYIFKVDGSTYLASAPTITSDENAKNNIKDLSPELAKSIVLGLRPVTHKYNDGTSDRTHHGLIAQDVKALLDELGIDTQDFAGYVVDTSSGTEKCYLRYTEFLPDMISLLQQQEKRISELEEKIAKLEQQ